MKKKPYGNSIANVLSDDIYICLIQLRRKGEEGETQADGTNNQKPGELK